MDDDLSIRKICTLLLDRLGFDVDTVPCGEEAIVLYKRGVETGAPYVAVILDLSVPTGMGGIDTLSRLRTIDPDVCAIMASGSSMDKLVASYRSHGFKAVLPKPFRLQDIQDCLQSVIPSALGQHKDPA